MSGPRRTLPALHRSCCAKSAPPFGAGTLIELKLSARTYDDTNCWPGPPPHPRRLQVDLRHVERAFERFQLGTMQFRKPGQQFLPGALEMDLDLTAIALAGLALDKPQGLASRDQGDHTVMLRLQALGQLADRRPFASRVALDMQQQQILQRRDALA